MAKTRKKVKTGARRKTSAGPATRERAGRVPVQAPPARGKLERVRLPAAAAKPPRAEMASSGDEANEGRYVYCIIKSERPLS